MMEEEGAVMGGLLVGLNVIDANLCIKGEDLDSQVSSHFVIFMRIKLMEVHDVSLSFRWESLTSPFTSKTLSTARLRKSECCFQMN